MSVDDNTMSQSYPQSLSETQDLFQVYANHFIGAAIFDLNGLPKEYFTTLENNNMSWVQTIFQALGLRLLLMSSLQLEGFHYALIHSDGYNAVVVKQPSCYTALLLKQSDSLSLSETFIKWAQTLEPALLRSHERFKST